MAKTHPDVEWFYDPSTYCADYGLICLAGKWAVVKKKRPFDSDDYGVITEWVDERKTAIGFLKLLKEK